MNSLLANTNRNRLFMFLAAGFFGIFTSVVFYKIPITSLTIRDPLNTGVIGILIFEFLYRTKRWLNIKTIGFYIIIVVLISQWLYPALYIIENGTLGGELFSLEPFTYLFSTFPYNLFFLIESSVVVSFAYYLIHLGVKESEVAVAETMTRKQNISCALIGAVTASLGGAIKYFVAITGVELFGLGIILPFYLCLLTPILGALAGLGGASISNKKNLGAFIGGLVIVLLFLPAPYLPQ